MYSWKKKKKERLHFDISTSLEKKKYFPVDIRIFPSVPYREDVMREKRLGKGEGGRVVESAEGKDRKERKRGTRFHKAILRTLFSHAHVESKARPISYGDSLTSSVHHRICLYRRRYWQPSFDEACRGGWLGSSMTGLRRLCAPRTCVMLVSSLSLSLSICLHLVRLRTSVCARNKGWRKEGGGREGGRKGEMRGNSG